MPQLSQQASLSKGVTARIVQLALGLLRAVTRLHRLAAVGHAGPAQQA